MREQIRLYRLSEKLSNIATFTALTALVWSSLVRLSRWFIVLFIVQISIATILVIISLRLTRKADKLA